MNKPCQETSKETTKNDTASGMTEYANPVAALQRKSDKLLLAESKELDENRKLSQTSPNDLPPLMGELGTDDSLPPRSCFPCNCRRGDPIFGGNKEALAWAVDNCASIASYVGTGAFLGTALLKLAKDAAGCEVEPPPGMTEVPDCNNRIYGIKPSSLLSTIGTVVNIITATLMPLCGAIVDSTSKRRLMGRIMVSYQWIFLFVSIFVSEQTWFAIAIMQIIWGCAVWFHNTIIYSYLPELSDDEATMRDYTKCFAALSYVTMIIYMGAITGASAAMGYLEDEGENTTTLDDEIKTASLAQAVSFAITVIGLGTAWWFLFEKRPAMRQIQEGESVWTSGFLQVGRTVREIVKNHLALKWFYISIMWSDPAIMALTILAITFLTDQLEFTAAENGTAMIMMMIFAVPGSLLGSWVTKKSNAVISSMVAVVIMIVTTVVVAIELEGAGQQTETYILSAFWGVGTGWKWMCDRMVLWLVLPPGQNAELMGIYVFFRQILAWLPMLVFTVINEKDVSMRIGIATLNIYFALCFLSLIRVQQTRRERRPTSVLPQQTNQNGEELSDTSHGEFSGPLGHSAGEAIETQPSMKADQLENP